MDVWTPRKFSIDLSAVSLGYNTLSCGDREKTAGKSDCATQLLIPLPHHLEYIQKGKSVRVGNIHI